MLGDYSFLNVPFPVRDNKGEFCTLAYKQRGYQGGVRDLRSSHPKSSVRLAIVETG
jgi:hypothetical protein